ncbi:hypothetical protein B0H21DRAFT_700382, partial [Amylocystis lapponica]
MLAHVCHERGIVLPGKIRSLKKKTIAAALLVCHHAPVCLCDHRILNTQQRESAPIPPTVQPRSNTTTQPTPHASSGLSQIPESLIGEGLVEEVASATDEGPDITNNSSDSVFRKEDLKRFERNIRATLRPVYSEGPPPKMGTSGHGKLKADQWKAAMEFELPVSLMKHWHQVELTDLSTSEHHCVQYTKYMHSYLSDLLTIKPDIALRPNHHMALHLGDFLTRFGPMHGWWMFPFERVIGILQQVNTNFKQGQFEKTMMNSFCAAANIKVFLKRPDCPQILKECEFIVEECYGGNQRGTLMTDICTL